MRKPVFLRTRPTQLTPTLSAAVLVLACFAPLTSHAQAAAEAAATTSGAAGVTIGTASKALGPFVSSAIPATAGNAAPAPLPMGVREGPAAEEANRKEFEQRAGKAAAKLLLRSEPTEALVYLDGKSVGLTPLLVLVAPGKHRVDMRGQHQEAGAGEVTLGENETRQYLLTLMPRFVTSVTVHPSAGAGVTPNFGGAASTGSAPATAIARATGTPQAAAPSGPPPEEANRKLLEDQSGSDAGKLQLNSNPADAQVFIDGIYVGRAPIDIRLAPGRHQVAMKGNGSSGERFIGLLPKETQQVTLSLTPLYPGQISIHWPRSSSESH